MIQRIPFIKTKETFFDLYPKSCLVRCSKAICVLFSSKALILGVELHMKRGSKLCNLTGLVLKHSGYVIRPT